MPGGTRIPDCRSASAGRLGASACAAPSFGADNDYVLRELLG